jgi:hypothetical protein
MFADRFQNFDYGKRKNKRVYPGKSVAPNFKPPEYNLKSFSKRIYLISGHKDTVATTDVSKLEILTILVGWKSGHSTCL